MSLSEAIKQTMNARDLPTAEVARRLGEGYDRATFYRLLNGATTEPRLGTLVGLCEVLDISPTELLQLSGLWPHRDRLADALDLRLRSAFARLQSLPTQEKRRAAKIVGCIADSWDAQSDEPEREGATEAVTATGTDG
jgi:transcriptional regulator with XRE-family HTH domain